MKQFYTVKDVMRILQVKEAKAYKIIRKLNEELEQRGYIVVSGKVSKRYFDEKVYINEDENMIIQYIDLDGGPMINIGDTIQGKKIKSIKDNR